MTTYLNRRVIVSVGNDELKEIRRNVTLKNGIATIRYQHGKHTVTCTSKHRDNPHAVWTIA